MPSPIAGSITDRPATRRSGASVASQTCCSDTWEAAYARFETPQQEIAKFVTRLEKLGANQWPRKAAIVELFCGRGNGLVALEQLGFKNLQGVDLSPTLAAQYHGRAPIHVANCKSLPMADASVDVAIVQGGLHHLEQLPEDLAATLIETCRVLRPGALFVAVEPWQTPFLSLVHAACRYRLACRLSPKVEALATMIRHEQRTYDQWLGSPQMILAQFDRCFTTLRRTIAWGKLLYVGQKLPGNEIR